MTQQETFKRRVRQRMEKTGERYGAARRVLIEQSAAKTDRTWAAQPEMSDEAVRTATGRAWNEWCDVIDAWPGRTQGHTAIAAYVRDDLGTDPWWAQAVTVGYERITGLRLPHQRPDGTFTAGKSRTVSVDPGVIRTMLLSDEDRVDLFPGIATLLRSRPTSKTLRLEIGPGVASIAIDPQSDGRAKVTIEHVRLPSFGDVENWKTYWDDWLTAIDEG